MDYGLIGEKLGHSFSAEIHTKLFGYKYDLCEIPVPELDAFMKSKDFKAINVTIPYKEKVIPYLDEVSEIAKKIGAVNTIVNKNGRLYGFNTDFFGLKSLISRVGFELKGKKVLVLGSGGTSKTAVSVSNDFGCKEVYKVSRNGANDCISYENAITKHSDAEIIINTTPCGMYPNIGESAIDISNFQRLEGVVDVVYNPLRSELICQAKKRGILATGGLFMLVAQAVCAAEKFVDKKADESKVQKIYQSLLKRKENIVLIGMPSCGKTTLGRILAKETGKLFIDTDSEIEKTTGKTINELFAESGEAKFRMLEAEVIKKVSSLQNAVIATGGGAVLNERNVMLLKENGRIYFIDRPFEFLVTTQDRPLSSNRTDLLKRYEERYGLYCSSCDVKIIPTDNKTENVKMIKEDFYNENTCN